MAKHRWIEDIGEFAIWATPGGQFEVYTPTVRVAIFSTVVRCREWVAGLATAAALKSYRIALGCDVRAWLKADMQFADDAAALAHAQDVAKTVREIGAPPPGHPTESAAFETDFHPGGCFTVMMDRLDANNEPSGEIADIYAPSQRERVEDAGAELLALLEDAVPILDVLIEDRELVIEDQCEVARDLRTRFKEAIAKAKGAAS
ncbi:hypothetical protein ACJ4V0_15750 [Phreatobacter sp. HK31-P]